MTIPCFHDGKEGLIICQENSSKKVNTRVRMRNRAGTFLLPTRAGSFSNFSALLRFQFLLDFP